MVKKVIVVFHAFCVSSFSSYGWQIPVPRSLCPAPPVVAQIGILRNTSVKVILIIFVIIIVHN